MPLSSRIVFSTSKKHAEASLQNFRRFGLSKRFFSSVYSRSAQSKISSHPLTEQTMMGDLEGLKCIKKFGSSKRFFSSIYSRSSQSKMSPHPLTEQTMMGDLEGLKCIKKHGSVRRYCSSGCESRNDNKPPPSLPDQAAAPTSFRSLEKEQHFRALDHSIETLKKEMDILRTELRTLRKTLDEIKDVREMPKSITQINVMDKKYEIITGANETLHPVHGAPGIFSHSFAHTHTHPHGCVQIKCTGCRIE